MDVTLIVNHWLERTSKHPELTLADPSEFANLLHYSSENKRLINLYRSGDSSNYEFNGLYMALKISLGTYAPSIVLEEAEALGFNQMDLR